MLKPVIRLVLILAVVFCLVAPASAGNIVLSGHDDDFHENFGAGPGPGGPAGMQLAAMAAFARMGATNPSLPVLAFDHGSELNSALTAVGVLHVTVDPDNAAAVTAAFVNASSLYSAIAVASDQSCGGCDNTTTSSTNLAAHKTDFTNFVNAGGGIIGLAGAMNMAYYNFLPTAASGMGFPPPTGYVQTADGLLAGIPAVNGNPTHNFFFEPGTGGTDPNYKVFERLGDPATGTAETIGLKGAIISVSGFVGVPEPGTLTLAGLALLGAAGYRLRRRKPDAA
jgi:hypothetical protein